MCLRLMSATIHNIQRLFFFFSSRELYPSITRNCSVFSDCKTTHVLESPVVYRLQKSTNQMEKRLGNNGYESSNCQLVLTQRQYIQRWQPLRQDHGICKSNWSAYHGRFERCPRIAQLQYWSSYHRTACVLGCFFSPEFRWCFAVAAQKRRYCMYRKRGKGKEGKTQPQPKTMQQKHTASTNETGGERKK